MAWENQRYIISYSGGIASAVSALIAAEKGLNFEMVFADTTIEDEDLYRFIDEVSTYIGKPYVHLKDGRDPWEVFVSKRYIGNTRTAHCSDVLKTAQVLEWMNKHGKPTDGLVLGMYRDEEDRLWRAQDKWAPRRVSSLLMSYGVFPGKARQILAATGIAEPRLYGEGYPHNNCGGFCVRAGQGQFATLLVRNRPRYLHHEARQEWAMEAIGPTAKPFLRATIKGKLEYLTMRQFRLMIEAGTLTPKMYEMGGCGCFVD